MKKDRFYLVHGRDDGWVVHTNKRQEELDYEVCVEECNNARFIEVVDFKENEEVKSLKVKTQK